MRIKEVEQLTGLTAKAIRLYESKGLLNVARNQENDYRDYSVEDVERLKTIAVLRQLDVPMKTIKEWTDGNCSLLSVLDDVKIENEKLSRDSQLKSKLIEGLRDAVVQQPDAPLPELMANLQELNQIMEELSQLSNRGDISVPLWWTGMSLGPVGMTVLRMTEMKGEADQLVIGFILSLISVVIAAFSWYRYLSQPKAKRGGMLGCLGKLAVAVIALVGVFFLIAWLTEIQNYFFCTDEKAIMLVRAPWSYGIFVLEVELMAGLYLITQKPWKGKKWKLKNILCVFAALVIVNAVLMYGYITSVSVATDQHIVRHSFFAPGGEEYGYDDIISVETGFGGKFLGMPVRGTGEFYYRVTYSDGVTEDWGECSSEWDDDSWKWMIRLDELVMAGGAEKIGNEECWEYCDMDQVYVDMLLEVIHNN